MTQVAELRRILADGEWHSTAEILRRHPMMVHSRVSDLRKAGLEVEHRTVGQGAAGSEYRIVLGEPSSAANGGSPSATEMRTEGGSRSPLLPAEPQDHGTALLWPTTPSLNPGSRAAGLSVRQDHSGRPPEPADGGDVEPRKEMVGEATVPVRLPGQLSIPVDEDDRCAAFCAQFCPHCGYRYDESPQKFHGLGVCTDKEDNAA